jgi:HlyD family secretion protein
MGTGPTNLGYGSYMTLLAAVMTASLALGLREGFKPAKPKSDITSRPILNRKITVTCLGRIEPQGQMVRVTGPSGSSDSRIEWLAVSEGDTVKQGQIIARLDNFATLQASAEEARQEVLVSQARLGVTQAGARPSEIAAQRAEIARLEADLVTREASQQRSLHQLQIELANAQTEFKRYQSLYLDGALSREEFERKQLALRLAEEAIQLNRSQAAQIVLPGRQQIETARQKLRLLDEVRPEEVESSRASIARAQSALASAQARLEQSRVRAPFRGTVLKLYSRIGEKVGTSGLLDLGNTEQMDVIAEVYETEIARLKKGQLAKVSSDALPGRTLQGRLITLGQRIQRQNVINSDPTSNIDERVMEVRIRLDRSSSQQVQNLTNLQVKVELQIQ